MSKNIQVNSLIPPANEKSQQPIDKNISKNNQRQLSDLDPNPEAKQAGKIMPIIAFHSDILTNLLSDLLSFNVPRVRMAADGGLIDSLTWLGNHWQEQNEKVKELMKKVVLVSSIIEVTLKAEVFNYLMPGIAETLESLRIKLEIPYLESLVEQQLALQSHIYGGNWQLREKQRSKLITIYRKSHNISISSTLEVIEIYARYCQRTSSLPHSPPCQVRKNQRIMNLPDYIRDLEAFREGAEVWRDALTFVQSQHFAQQRRQRQEKYMERVEREPAMSVQCMRCVGFLVHETSFGNCGGRGTPFVVIRSWDGMGEEDKEAFRRSVVATVNSRGVILLGCQQRDLRYYANGLNVKQSQKERVSQESKSFILGMRSVVPELTEEQIKMTWLPLMQNHLHQFSHNYSGLCPYSRKRRVFKGDQGYWSRKMVKDRWVLRIDFRTDPSKLCCMIGESKIEGFLWQRGLVRNLSAKQSTRTIKRRLKHQLKANCLSQEEKDIFARSRSNHDYMDPYPYGYQVEDKEPQLSSAFLIIPEKEATALEGYLRQFDSHCSVQQPFLSYCLRKGNISALLRHSVDLSILKDRIISMPSVVLTRRIVPPISIGKHLKIIKNDDAKSLNDEEFVSLQGWLHAEFPDSQLGKYEFRERQSNVRGEQRGYYVRTEPEKALYFMFLVIRNFKVKTIFLDPQGLDEMTEEERSRRYRRLWPSSERL